MEKYVEEIEHNELMSKKHKKVCTALNYIEHSLILASAVTGCTSIFAFASSVVILIGITNSARKKKLRINLKNYKN